MAHAKIMPSFLKSSALSRRHCTSFLRPPNLLSTSTPGANMRSIRDHPFYFVAGIAVLPALRYFSSTSNTSSATPSYTYSIAAAYSDKKHTLNPSENTYTYNASHRVTKTVSEITSEQHKLKRPKSGQDAFFVSHVNNTGSLAFGVVDGVGGWETSGVDPADFAHGLCEYMANAAAGWPEGFKDTETVVKPRELLDVGYQRVMEDNSISGGGSTACIATVSPAGVLEAANLGDSGYAHMSPFRMNYVSPAQTHAFNTPFQFSKLPAKMQAQLKLFGGAKPFQELPSDAALSTQQLNHGDILIFATDGVWDNLSPEDALRIVSRLMLQLQAWVIPEEGSPGLSANFTTLVTEAVMKIPSKDVSITGLSTLLAAAITHEAKEASLNQKRDGPFAKEVQKAYPEENWRGGKPDDICTVVVVVTKEGV